MRSIEDRSFISSMVHILSGISRSICLAEGSTKGFSKAEILEVVDYDEPKPSLRIEYDAKAFDWGYIDSFMMREEEEELQQQELPCRVQYLVLKGCKYPVKLEQVLQSLRFLRGLSITDSPQIFSFQEASLPSQLRFIFIYKCDSLQSLPRAWMHSSNTSLKNLSIGHCDSLKCIARVQLPPNLKRLEIKHCSNLLSVLDEEEVSGSCNNTSCLEHLRIKYCPSLTSLWSKSNELPKALRYLRIENCSKLESIAEGFHDNTKLEELYIVDCVAKTRRTPVKLS
ncbi:hypothetical protein LWI29_030004 [Acer saccharum]|uniref:Disease resistance protein At4g27190-like leucine-rich repeats domain-containing protein n=1 Tax=Acer saccharum TaxID=4024 RepID=A0AA39VEA1_ACESA|nr:hypothetical protein LWI29_030004 [Acer saccharum]